MNKAGRMLPLAAALAVAAAAGASHGEAIRGGSKDGPQKLESDASRLTPIYLAFGRPWHGTGYKPTRQRTRRRDRVLGAKLRAQGIMYLFAGRAEGIAAARHIHRLLAKGNTVALTDYLKSRCAGDGSRVVGSRVHPDAIDRNRGRR